MTKHNDIAPKTMELFRQCVQHFNGKDELSVFAGQMAGLSIALMRGIEGNEFVDGFLHAAKNEESPLVISPQLIN